MLDRSMVVKVIYWGKSEHYLCCTGIFFYGYVDTLLRECQC